MEEPSEDHLLCDFYVHFSWNRLREILDSSKWFDLMPDFLKESYTIEKRWVENDFDFFINSNNLYKKLQRQYTT